MKRIVRYIFRQLLGATIFVAVTLTCVVWLTQSLRFIEMIVNRGLSIPLFVYFTMLLLPTFFAVILPIAVFASVMFTYNRLLVDSELVVLRAAGCSQFMIARPAIILATLVTIFCYSLTTYFIPTSYREFKDLQFSLRNSLPTVMLQEGVFNPVIKGVTVYVRNNIGDGELSGIVIHDARSPKSPITLMAERGVIVSTAKGPRVVMLNGNRQQVDDKDGRLSLLYFDRYSFDIDAITKDPATRWREPRERYLTTLLKPNPDDKWAYNKLIMEGHHRLSSPLFPLAFTFVGIALLLGGYFNRRGQLWRVLVAVGVVIILETSHLVVKHLAEKAPHFAFLMYTIPILPIIISAWFLSDMKVGRRGKSSKPPPSPLAEPGSQ